MSKVTEFFRDISLHKLEREAKGLLRQARGGFEKMRQAYDKLPVEEKRRLRAELQQWLVQTATRF